MAAEATPGRGEGGTFLTQGSDERGVAFPHEDPATARVATYESTRLHSKAKELARVDDQLASTKEQYAQRCRELKEREQEFLEKQADMIESIRKFKGFIVETDTKRHRALLKASDEHKTVKRHEESLADLRRRLGHLREAQEQQAAKYARLRPYRDFLEGVVRESEDFEDIGELTTRFKILRDTHSDLRHEAARVQQAVETTQAELQALRKQKQNEVLVHNSTIARLQKTLEDQSRSTNNLESEVEGREFKARDAAARFGQIHMAIRNLYERVLHSRDISSHKKKKKRGQGRIVEEPARAGESLKQRQAQQLGFFSSLLEEIGGRVVELHDIAAMTEGGGGAGAAGAGYGGGYGDGTSSYGGDLGGDSTYDGGR